MYERSAIVLEKYMEKILEFNKPYNLKKNYENYTNLIEEIEQYQIATTQENKVIQEFDDTINKIENIQLLQGKLSNINKKLEEDREKLFNELGEDSETLNKKLKKVENAIDKNNEELKELRSDFVEELGDFTNRQRERNKCEKARRVSEANHIAYLKKANEDFEEIDGKDLIVIKDFMNSEKESIKEEINQIMLKNGRNEKTSFNQDVMKKAIKARMEVAEKEAECYIFVYDKMRRLLSELDSETIRLDKYKKALKIIQVKIAFLEAEKEYITGFLDYERMTAISGTKVHNKKMEEACQNFELDKMQIQKLYELILRECNKKATKKAYDELYNKYYLTDIENKEKNFEQEMNHISIKAGTVINSNYWRIEGIKNIYMVFQEEVSQKFEKDLSEYQLAEEELEYEEEEDLEEDDLYEIEEEETDDPIEEKEVTEQERRIQEILEEYQDMEEEDDDIEQIEDKKHLEIEKEDEEDDDYHASYGIDENETEESNLIYNPYAYQYVDFDEEEEKEIEEEQQEEKQEEIDSEEELYELINRKKATGRKNKANQENGIWNKLFKEKEKDKKRKHKI